eukprot:TRINITY_DN10993_c0_g1_i3.p1 TRINITY_DN10993_c0_g1~~TRINITY_DN10993_c0_g1_i3.p1  ORF type:complete len:853 (+),score=190.40 TRINITY_DN10993_c0_g1_i3:42-2600(+)
MARAWQPHACSVPAACPGDSRWRRLQLGASAGDAARRCSDSAAAVTPCCRKRRVGACRVTAAAALRSLIVYTVAAGSQAITAAPRLQLRWGQTNTTVTVSLDVKKQLGCPPGDSADVEVSISGVDQFAVLAGCEGVAEDSRHRWEFELREDVVPEQSRIEKPAVGGQLIVLRKQTLHRWDRLLQREGDASVMKDWKREDRNLPDEDEYELPRALNIKQLSYDGLAKAASDRVVIAALRYPWCLSCAEKDKAFVKATKKINIQDVEGRDLLFASLDVREHKQAARRWNITCRKDHCPLRVFKPDEPLDEPYTVEMRLLYEMDEYSMMTDPMAGSPGHMPKAQTVKPDFERFEREIELLLPPAVTFLDAKTAVEDFKARNGNVVVASGIDTTSFRRSARRLRGVASFAWVKEQTAVNAVEPFAELWADHATPQRKALSLPLSDGGLDEADVERFVKIHVQPLLQNYTWDLKAVLDGLDLPVAVLWANFSDSNSTEVTENAVVAFRNFCDKNRGTNRSRHVICCIKDGTYAYYQREFGNHEPYPFPYFGLTTRLGFGEGERYGYPFTAPQNETIAKFFRTPNKASKSMSAWVSKVLSGRVAVSHESGKMPEDAPKKWSRGLVQDIVWKTYQKEVNGSTSDILLELYDNQRKQAHIASGVMRTIAAVLKDYKYIKVARMETSQNYVQPIFGRKQYEKETEYYWVPPSLVSDELTPMAPVRYNGSLPTTPEKLLHFFKKHTVSSWSLKEALEAAGDVGEEIMGQARIEQREDDRAEQDKQAMIKKMMTTLKKEKGLVDVGEMMGLKKAAETMGAGEQAAASPEDDKTKKKRKTKGANVHKSTLTRRDSLSVARTGFV